MQTQGLWNRIHKMFPTSGAQLETVLSNTRIVGYNENIWYTFLNSEYISESQLLLSWNILQRDRRVIIWHTCYSRRPIPKKKIVSKIILKIVLKIVLSFPTLGKCGKVSSLHMSQNQNWISRQFLRQFFSSELVSCLQASFRSFYSFIRGAGISNAHMNMSGP